MKVKATVVDWNGSSALVLADKLPHTPGSVVQIETPDLPKPLGQVAYEVSPTAFLWSAMTQKERDYWESVAQAVIAAAKERGAL